ncbi:FAD-binding oxidoreductase [Candidatus Spongiisocius sp.]|uniref:FAD-binding oxidoreductase n=1 Tax=Candidatus Spongiisocius sp. TaxID=3101273 RepID=UPI003B596DF6
MSLATSAREGSGLPAAAPETVEEAAGLMANLPAGSDRIRIRGGGSHRGIGYPVASDVVLSTSRLDRVVAWEPDDLTVVVEAGVLVEELEQMLASKGQTALLPEQPGTGTVGGAIATATSGWRRHRYGPIRDRVLELTLVSSDGRIVTAGGRVVKNVTGYDIPRLATGSLGAMGLIARVCLKLWPVPQASATVPVESPEEALEVAFRPLAVLETREGAAVFLGGTHEEVVGQAAALGAEPVAGLNWPSHPSGAIRFSVRTPPSSLRGIVDRLDPAWTYLAQFGVGEATVAADEADFGELDELRRRAESLGGALVMLDAPAAVVGAFDPWGTPPPSIEIQRRVVNLFDPGRRINRGILPGRI